MEKCAIYIRETNFKSIELQREIVEKIAKVRNFEIYKVYEDLSPKNKLQPELTNMFNDAREGKFSILLAADLAILNRNLKNVMKLIEKLKEFDIELIIERNFVDNKSSFFQTIFLFAAEYEQVFIAERELKNKSENDMKSIA